MVCSIFALLLRCAPIPAGSTISMASQTLPVISGDKDRSLQEVLGRLTSSRAPLGAEAEPIVTAIHRMPPVTAAFGPYPDGTDERLKTALAGRGIEQLYTHQSEAFAHVLGGRNVVTITPTASGKTLCYNAPVLNSILKDPSTRALYLFPTKALAQDQLAELHALSQLVDARHRCGDRRVHLRRRHAVRCAPCHPRQGACRPEQSRHGAFRHPAASSALGEAVRESAVRHRRRAARLPRRVRQPSRQHPSATAARLPSLRVGSDLHLLIGDDREPARAGRRIDRTSIRTGDRQRRAARGEVLSVRQSAGRERGAGHPPLVPARNASRGDGVSQAEPPDHRLCAEPSCRRDPDDVSERHVSWAAGIGGNDSRISRRLPAEPPP